MRVAVLARSGRVLGRHSEARSCRRPALALGSALHTCFRTSNLRSYKHDSTGMAHAAARRALRRASSPTGSAPSLSLAVALATISIARATSLVNTWRALSMLESGGRGQTHAN